MVKILILSTLKGCKNNAVLNKFLQQGNTVLNIDKWSEFGDDANIDNEALAREVVGEDINSLEEICNRLFYLRRLRQLDTPWINRESGESSSVYALSRHDDFGKIVDLLLRELKKRGIKVNFTDIFAIVNNSDKNDKSYEEKLSSLRGKVISYGGTFLRLDKEEDLSRTLDKMSADLLSPCKKS